MIVLKSTFYYNLILKVDMIRKIIFNIMAYFPYILEVLKVKLFFFFVYGNIALYIYGGSVNSGSSKIFEERFGEVLEEPESLFNFNDFFNSAYTLMVIMLTGYEDYFKYLTLGSSVSWLNSFYFVSFYFVTYHIFISILCGLVGEGVAEFFLEHLKEHKHENHDEGHSREGKDGGESGNGDH